MLNFFSIFACNCNLGSFLSRNLLGGMSFSFKFQDLKLLDVDESFSQQILACLSSFVSGLLVYPASSSRSQIAVDGENTDLTLRSAKKFNLFFQLQINQKFSQITSDGICLDELAYLSHIFHH